MTTVLPYGKADQVLELTKSETQEIVNQYKPISIQKLWEMNLQKVAVSTQPAQHSTNTFPVPVYSHIEAFTFAGS